jgi:4-amino-4-deoxy-L-arabinose transferase-like glycosyltransferase
VSTKALSAPPAVLRWPRRDAQWLILLPLVLIVPLAAGALAVRGNFDGLYGQDPYAYYSYAVGPLRQNLLRWEAPPPFYWPPGYPLLVALASFIVGTGPFAGQMVSLLAGALVPLFTALLAHEIWSHGRGFHLRVANPLLVPFIAGLIAAFHGQLWQSSTIIMADTTGLAAATLSFLALARYGRLASLRWLLLAVGALAFAVLTRWPLAPLALPATIYTLFLFKHQTPRRVFAHAAAALGLVSIMLGPLLFATFSGTVAPSGISPNFGSSFEVFNWNPLNAFQRDFVTLEGFYHYKLPVGLYYAVAPARTFAFTPLLAAFALPGLLRFIRQRTWEPLVLLGGWAAVIYLFLSGFAYQNFRYTLALVPPIAILIAIGFARAREAMSGRADRFLTLILLLGLGWMAMGGVQLTQGFTQRKQADLSAVQWVESQLPADVRLLTFGVTLTFQHYAALETLELYELSPDDLAHLTSDAQPTFLLLDVESTEQQWKDRPPLVNYQWLRGGPGLAELGRSGPYTLFRVGAVP